MLKNLMKKNAIKRPGRQEGASAVEYGLIVALIVGIIVGVMTLLNTGMTGLYTNVNTELTGAPTTLPPAAP